MRRSLGVGFVLLLAVLLLNPSGAEAQTTGRARPTVGQNYPNPFNPTTRIPLTLPAELFEGGKPVTVSMRITNMLLQPVAVPVALGHPEGNVRVTNLKYYEPGTHIMYWDGTDRDGRKVGSAMYLLHVEVNGERLTPIRLVVTK